MSFVSSYQDLHVYKLSRELAKEIYERSKQFPPEEKFSLTDQIRRSSRSIRAQIAESWAKRRYEKHFISKLSDADGEQMETEHWVGVSEDCTHITPEEVESWKINAPK
jgi:four helix bundle protein